MRRDLRLFVAFDVDAEVKRRLAREIAFLQLAGAKVSWLKPEQMHVTLRFLGAVRPEELLEIEEAVAKAAEEGVSSRPMVRGVHTFPRDGAPRVIVAGMEGDVEPMQALHRVLEERLREIGMPPDKRFTPHVTLGRVKGKVETEDLARRIAEGSERRFGLTDANVLHVMSSDTTPKGPIYTSLASFPLG